MRPTKNVNRSPQFRVHAARSAARLRGVSCALSALVAVEVLLGAPPVTPDEATAVAHASAILEAVHQASAEPGLAAAVAIDGEVVWERYLGMSDLEASVPVTAGTRFRIGSVSKAVTAVTLARLAQRGAIDLDADVRQYVPEFPENGSKISPRMLAGHLAGVRSYQQKDFAEKSHIDRRHFATTAEALAIFSDDPLEAPPGSRYHYSVFGYTLLSAAIEGATGQDFLTVLETEVLTPLALANTGADTGAVAGRATAYERTAEGKATIAEPLDFSYKWAGGGLYSNVQDLVRLGSALLDPEFLDAATLALLTTAQTTDDGFATEVGLGWRVATDYRHRPFLHHAGSIAGGRAVILVYPQQRAAVAITSNQALAPLLVEPTAQMLIEPFLLQQDGERFDRIRQVGAFDFIWKAQGHQHQGSLLYGDDPDADSIDLHPALNAWSSRLGSSAPDQASLLPMLLSGDSALIPVVTPAGAFGIAVTVGGDDSVTGEVVGQYLRVSGAFHATRRTPERARRPSPAAASPRCRAG